MKAGFAIIGIFISVVVLSQEFEAVTKKELRYLNREEKKARRHFEKELAIKQTYKLLKQRRFVMEADYLSTNYGRRIPVDSKINFIIIDSTNAVLQIGNATGMGYNGAGGVTVEGDITNYRLTERETKKGKSYYLLVFIPTSLGIYDVSFNITDDGRCDATVTGTSPGRLIYSGHLVPIEQSSIYKGSSY